MLASGLGLVLPLQKSQRWRSAQNQQTLVVTDTQLEFGGVVGSFLQSLLFFSLPELKVCIYFSHKRLVFNPGEGIYLLSNIHCSEVFYLKK